MSPRVQVVAIRWRTKSGDASDAIEGSSRSAAAAVPAGPRAVVKNGSVQRGGSVVYAPVPEASDLPYSPPPEQPAVQQAGAAGRRHAGCRRGCRRGAAWPPCTSTCTSMSTQPQQRFIFVNSRKYKEGDTLAEGPLVEQITPDGAVLNFRGSRFKLSND